MTSSNGISKRVAAASRCLWGLSWFGLRMNNFFFYPGKVCNFFLQISNAPEREEIQWQKLKFPNAMWPLRKKLIYCSTDRCRALFWVGACKIMIESTARCYLSGWGAFKKVFCDLEMTFGWPWSSISVNIGKVKNLKYTFDRSFKYKHFESSNDCEIRSIIEDLTVNCQLSYYRIDFKGNFSELTYSFHIP